VRRLKVSVSEDVKLQIREHVLYIAEDSIDNALAWEDRVRAPINHPGDMAGHGIDEEASRRIGRTVRKFVFEKIFCHSLRTQ